MKNSKSKISFFVRAITLAVTIFAGFSSMGQLQLCTNSSQEVWADSRGQSVVNIGYTETKRFITRPVCGASSYTWTISGGGSILTTTNSINFVGRDLVWLPPGGCYDFNQNWEAYNPLYDWKYPCSWQGGAAQLGDYNAILSVQADNSSTSATVSVIISNVEVCRDDTSC